MGMMFRGFAGDDQLGPMQMDRGGMATPALAPPKPGFFDRGGLGVNLLGNIGDAVASAFGAAPTFAPVQQQYRQRQMQLADQQRETATRYGLWEAQQAYKAAHPDPTDLSDRVGYLNALKPGLGNTYAENYASNGGGLPQVMNVPGVGLVSVPRQQAATAAPSAPTIPDAAVSYLRQNPAMAAQFDQKYGQGASARYLGGAASQAPSPFPTR